jgi:DNA-binding transcriptional LysR family regulator
LRLLGFAAGQPVHVAAVCADQPLDRVAAAVCPAHLVKVASVFAATSGAAATGAAAAVPSSGVLLATKLGEFPPGVRAGVGADPHPARAWREAQVALRFTTSRTPVVHHTDLGALALLAHVPADNLRANADVTAVAALSPEDLETLDAYCATGSLRRAADLLHLHHSSVSRRLEQIGKVLDVTDLARVKLALAAFRLL